MSKLKFAIVALSLSFVSQTTYGKESKMPHVTGIGGVFFKSKGDPKALTAWYGEHLGIKMAPWGGAIFKPPEDRAKDDGSTAWNIDEKNTDKYSPSESSFMINYRVDDLIGLMAHLKKSGVTILKDTESTDYGKFASIMDPEGNKIELWEP